jgi:two-component system, cell cycle sensor histidine kinase and response regulator CckA
MPNMGGRKLVQKIRELVPSMPVIFTSGYTSDALDETDELESDCEFLSKPYGPDALAKKVHESLSVTRRESSSGLEPEVLAR